MKNENKVRIVCSECLYTKLLNRDESDPKNTRFIIGNGCPKCSDHEVILRYFDDDMKEITPKN